MVGLDVGDDDDVGVVLQQRPVALVGFGDEDVAGAVVGVGAGLVEFAADRERRIVGRRAAGPRSASTWWTSCRACPRRAACGARASGRRARRGAAAPGCRGGAPRRVPGSTFGIAAMVVTTTVGPPGSMSSAEASWPTRTSAPRARSASTVLLSFASDPDTAPPRARRIRAIPDMPAPPIPTICTRDNSAGKFSVSVAPPLTPRIETLGPGAGVAGAVLDRAVADRAVADRGSCSVTRPSTSLLPARVRTAARAPPPARCAPPRWRHRDGPRPRRPRSSSAAASGRVWPVRRGR